MELSFTYDGLQQKEIDQAGSDQIRRKINLWCFWVKSPDEVRIKLSKLSFLRK